MPHKESDGQKCGQRAKGRLLVQVLFIMFSQPVYSKAECSPLYMVMKQLSADSVSQAVCVADELL